MLRKLFNQEFKYTTGTKDRELDVQASRRLSTLSRSFNISQ